MNNHPKSRIIDVTRKPSKCPVCGSRVVDIIYGTGDMTELEFLLKYGKDAIMGGDYIPRRPPIWCCACGCKRFRKVNPDGTDAAVKVKLLKNVRKAAETTICWTSGLASQAVENHKSDIIHQYLVEVTTELDEHKTLKISAVSCSDAENEAELLIMKGLVGLHGEICTAAKVVSIE